MDKAAKRIIAREALILTGMIVIWYAFASISPGDIPIVYPKYKVRFANRAAHIIEVYPEIGYSNVSNRKAFLKFLQEVHHPSSKLIRRRIEEFARSANISAALEKAELVNNIQIKLSDAYARFWSQNLLVKIGFVYLSLLLIRFIVWAIRALA
ncbi:MAG: hypothetical protein PHR44_06330 [Candidatus Omnitrophica bacterium]|nr:hypothetical protein [Candidatus Omnitrophota bacterium]